VLRVLLIQKAFAVIAGCLAAAFRAWNELFVGKGADLVFDHLEPADDDADEGDGEDDGAGEFDRFLL